MLLNLRALHSINMGLRKIVKLNFTYDQWLQKYKSTNVYTITLEEHTKYSKEFAAWRAGNIEKVH